MSTLKVRRKRVGRRGESSGKMGLIRWKWERRRGVSSGKGVGLV